MNKILAFLFLSAAASLVFGCARTASPDSERPVLSLAPSYGAVSRASSFSQGDALGVWAAADGFGFRASGNALDHQKFTAGADGVTFASIPAAHYPNERDAVRLYAYFPYQVSAVDPHSVAFSVQTDQSTPENFKKSDLCWGSTATTPSEAPVPLTFQHLLSCIRIVLAPAQAVEGVWLPDAVTNGSLDAETGVFTAGSTKAEVRTSGDELILPAQALHRLTVRSGGADYLFEPQTAIALSSGYTYTLTLTLSPTARTASLAAVTVAAWAEGSSSGAIAQGVSNSFTAHWAMPSQGYADAAKAVLTVSAGEGAASRTLAATNFQRIDVSDPLMCTYAFEVAAPDGSLGYPYTIQDLSFYDGSDQLIESVGSVLGATVYKPGAYTLGLQQKNLLRIAEGRIDSYADFWASGSLSGAVDNTFALHLLEPQAMGYDYTLIEQVRLTIDGAAYLFPAVTFTSRSNTLLAVTQPFAFSTARPSGYPYTIKKVELLKADGGLVGAFDADIWTHHTGPVSMQLYYGKALMMVQTASVSAIGTTTSVADTASHTSTVYHSPVELVYTLGSGAVAAGKEATKAAKAVLTVQTNLGTAEVTVSGFAMRGTPLAAYSTNALNLAAGAGWPAGARYPYKITHVSLLDAENGVLVPKTALGSPATVRGGGKTTLGVMKFN